MRQAVRAEVARAVQRIDDATREMADSLEGSGLSYPFARVQSIIVGYVAAARGIQLSDRTQVEKAEILQEITAPLHTVLCTRWWHFRSRVAALMELPSVLAKYNPEVLPVVEPAKADEVRAAAMPPAQSGSNA